MVEAQQTSIVENFPTTTEDYIKRVATLFAAFVRGSGGENNLIIPEGVNFFHFFVLFGQQKNMLADSVQTLKLLIENSQRYGLTFEQLKIALMEELGVPNNATLDEGGQAMRKVLKIWRQWRG